MGTTAADSAATEPVQVRRRPAPPLRPYIAWYDGYRQDGAVAAVHRGLPSPYLTLVLTLDEPLHIAAHPDPRQAPGTYEALLGGLHTTPVLIRQAHPQTGIQLAVSPLGARALFGLPAGELAGIDLAADEVLGRLAPRLCDRLRAADTWRERFALLDAALLGHARPGQQPPPEVVHVWSRLLAEGGGNADVGRLSTGDPRAAPTEISGVDALAAEVGWSSRHLRNRFRAEIGLSPKAAERVVRFDRARRLLQAAPDRIALAELAVTCGYYDQAHLARDFRAFAGCAPSRWLAEEFRFVQVPAWDAGEDSVA